MERLTKQLGDGRIVSTEGVAFVKNAKYGSFFEGRAIEKLAAYENAEERGVFGKWIPVSERLPEDYVPVNITWVNHNPVTYYASIKDVPFTATGICYKGKWYWYSAVCEDYLKEYGERYEANAVDADIEVIAWMPLPEAVRESEDRG